MNDLMNQNNETINQTPIEIALRVSDEGMTTARNLYAFLGLNLANFSHWCKRNIIENGFAEEEVDYFRFVFQDETPTGGKVEREDYNLTAHFAKKLSMQGKGEKGEQAREYFTRLEEKNKEIAISRNSLSPELRMFMQMGEAMARQELEQKHQSEKIAQIEEKQDAINQTFMKPAGEDFRGWVRRCLSAIAESDNYPYMGSRQERHMAVREESYERLNNKRPCRLKQRVESEKGRAAMAGASQTKINAINKLTIIEGDKDLKPIYETVVREMMIAYCVNE